MVSLTCSPVLIAPLSRLEDQVSQAAAMARDLQVERRRWTAPYNAAQPAVVVVGELAAAFAHEPSQPIAAVLTNAQNLPVPG